ncbi:MAG: protein translocase subunit SecD [bacterium]
MADGYFKKIFAKNSRSRLKWAIFGIVILFLVASFIDLQGFKNVAASGLDNGLSAIPVVNNLAIWPTLEKSPLDGSQTIKWKNIRQIDLNTYGIPFRLGLDLQGGAHLVYQADVSSIDVASRADSINGVRDMIERRVNALGVSEPLIQTEQVGENWRVIVELAGVYDVNSAIKKIGEMPLLEFKEADPASLAASQAVTSTPFGTTAEDQIKWLDTKLTGQQLDKAKVNFDPNTGSPVVDLSFNQEGANLFAEITKRNVGKPVAIFLDGKIEQTPRVNEPILNGQAVISGNYSLTEAKTLVQRLNEGALPVPIHLISQTTVGASLGSESVQRSLWAGLYGLLLVAIFMILYYRLPGLLSVKALLIYTVVALALFKLIPVTLTLAGIAGFILSIGMAVDANVLIFERLKEEIRAGRDLPYAVNEGFHRAWTSIRDSNVSSLITCTILFYFGTSIIKGFALTLAIGILVSLFSAITITRQFLKLVVKWKWLQNLFLYGAKPKQQ